jgi:hypothetical protein
MAIAFSVPGHRHPRRANQELARVPNTRPARCDVNFCIATCFLRRVLLSIIKPTYVLLSIPTVQATPGGASMLLPFFSAKR